jgi:hypothetical protein
MDSAVPSYASDGDRRHTLGSLHARDRSSGVSGAEDAPIGLLLTHTSFARGDRIVLRPLPAYFTEPTARCPYDRLGFLFRRCAFAPTGH